MSGDSVPIVLPFSRFATDACEATTLYRELRKPLLRYLVCLGLSSDEAQDVVQDAFLSLHRHLSAGGSQENIRSWLFRVAHNGARNRQNRYDRRFGAPIDPEMDRPRTRPRRNAPCFRKKRFQRLENAMRHLPEAERECLLLRAGGLRYREIGEVLGIADFDGGRHGGSRDQETCGEMQCVNIREN